MRVWFRKIHCPSSICFLCKPPQHLYTPPRPQTNSPFGSENNHRSPSPPASAAAAAVASNQFCAPNKEELLDDENEIKPCGELILRSSIKRKGVSGGEEGRKKTVQWMDVAGKDLVDVKEFETSESEDSDTDSEHNRGCIFCWINLID